MRKFLLPVTCFLFFAESISCFAAESVGLGANTFKPVPGWGGVPEKVNIGPTHGGVAVDTAGRVYVTSDGPKGIFVFSSEGELLRTMAPEFSTIHGLCIHEENGEEFIYAAHQKGAQAVKLKLDGTPVLKLPYPPEASIYLEGAGFKPTIVAVAPDHSIFVADGYGLSFIHKYDASGKYLKTFGGKGKGDGKFTTCHGMTIDQRFGKPLLLVCDRENNRLVHMDMDGNFIAVITTELRRPAAVTVHGDHAAIAELQGRVSIIDKTNNVVASFENPDKTQWAKFDAAPESWEPGVFPAPHGICYDAAGNLYVADWSKTGRVSKLIKAAK